jgi:carboxylesterase type B
MRFASRAVSALLLLQSLVSADEARVQTPLGPVQGLVLPDGSGRLFMGVPYAAPITRWRDSTPVAAWAPSTLDATVEAPGCIQLCTEDEPPHICPAHQSEQCLIVNIWTPRLPATGSPSWPVIVFMHGGSVRSRDGPRGARLLC